MIQGKLIEWVVAFLLSKLDKDAAADAIVAVLRAGVSALSAVAAKTETPLDDLVVKKAAEVVEELAAALKVK